MKKFVIERNLPGASNLTSEELEEMSQTAVDAIQRLGRPYQWVQSFVTEDKIYCVYLAESEEIVREHSKLANLPVNTISEVRIVIDPLNPGGAI